MQFKNLANINFLKNLWICLGLTIDFYEFGFMIKSVLIGKKSDVEKYSQSLSQSRFLKLADHYLLEKNQEPIPSVSLFDGYDALFLVSNLQTPVTFFEYCIRNRKCLYFSDQVELTIEDLDYLRTLYGESGSLLFPELTELNHPLVEDFISTMPGRLNFSYFRSLTGKRDIRQALITALAFLSLLSPVPAKKIDVSTFDTTITGRPTIKVRMKMYDSSVSQIVLDIDNKSEHEITIESAKGIFKFNLSENYLENIHGAKFYGDAISETTLLERTINSFAMSIILNSKPVFSFSHYHSVISQINKIEIVLKNNF